MAKKGKKGKAQKMAKVAERAMRGSFDSFVKNIGECATKGESEAEWSMFGYSDGQIETLRKMFEREGFTFISQMGGTFRVRW